MTKKLAYKPTTAEMKLLEVITDPSNKDLNVIQKCEKADISQRHYYDIWKKKDFVEYYNKLRLDLVKAHVGDVLNATIKFATESATNHQDRKMLLEMGGMYTERIKQELTGEGGSALQVVFSGKMKKGDKS